MQRFSDAKGTLVLEMEDHDYFQDNGTPEPDPDWKTVDPEGHEHHWKFLRPNIAATDPEGASPSLPTLRYIGDSEGAHYVCKVCGWPVQPGKRLRGTGQFQTQRKEYRLNGCPLTEEAARLVFAIIRSSYEEDDLSLDLEDIEALPEPSAVGDDKQ